MSKQDLVGCHIKIKDLAGADPHHFMFNVGDVLEVVQAKSRGSELNSIEFKFKDKSISWAARPEHYEIVAHPKEWYKDKWIVFTKPVSHEFLENTPYQIKECQVVYHDIICFIFHEAPYELWTKTSFTVYHNRYKIVDAPTQQESLLEEAKKRYPVGTKYKCALNQAVHVVEKQTFKEYDSHTIHGEHAKGCLYLNGKWAEIVTTTTEPILSEQIAGFIREAERRYPKGTKYIPTSRYSRNTDESSGTFIWNSSDRVEDKVNGTGIYDPKKNKWAEIVSAPEKTSGDLLLEEARRRYPVGTKYKCASSGVPYTVEPGIDRMYTFVNRSHRDDIDAGNVKGYFYYKGKWAEIIVDKPTPVTDEQSLEQTLLEQAHRRYPIGTVYKCAHAENHVTVQGDFRYGHNTKYITDGWGGCVYFEGKWADIITPTVSITVKQPSTPESKIQHIPDLNVSLRKEKKHKRLKHL